METVYYLILVPMVYLSVAVFVVGTIFRLASILRGPKQTTTLQIFSDKRHGFLWTLHDAFLMPTIRRHKPVFWIFLMVFHVCLVLLIIGHLELIWDIGIFQILPHDVFIGKGVVGLLSFLCLLFFMYRRFLSPVRELSVAEDYLLLVLLLLVVLFGSEMDWARRWYAYDAMTVGDYREYLIGMLKFSPELPWAVSEAGHSFMLVAHVFFANIFLIFFPFSQSMHSFLSIPINKLRRG
ncbi:MAG: respiratory nitrate reductase subunit gamma [Desulfobacteraceae bacterium]|nr:respiratory nitrate reductase subunit gamma [Desulfobacteraceae bacterium]